MTGWPVLWLCQIAAVRASRRCSTRTVTPSMVRPPWRSRSSWPLRVSLTDSMRWRRALNSDAAGGQQARLDVEQVDQDLALVGLGVGQRERDRQAVDGGDQVQAQAPEVAGVGGAVAVP